jgi:hypothetical protein
MHCTNLTTLIVSISIHSLFLTHVMYSRFVIHMNFIILITKSMSTLISFHYKGNWFIIPVQPSVYRDLFQVMFHTNTCSSILEHKQREIPLHSWMNHDNHNHTILTFVKLRIMQLSIQLHVLYDYHDHHKIYMSSLWHHVFECNTHTLTCLIKKKI